jgi:hypothetical protein
MNNGAYYVTCPLDSNLEISVEGKVWNKRLKRFQKINYDKDGRPKTQAYGNNRLVYRLVMATFFPQQFLEKLHVHHKDGDCTNNHITNLEWLTPKQHAQAHKNMRKTV